MDPASASLTSALVGSGTPRRCVFVLTSRTKIEADDDAPVCDAMSWVRLRPLDEAACKQLFSSLTQTLSPSTDLAAAKDRIELSAGNPLFLRWLLVEAPAPDGGELPVSLTDLLTQRVRRLSDSTLRAFVAAVLLGKHCRLDRLARLAGLNEAELIGSIQSLENQGFLEAEGADVRSAHPMLSQAALNEFPPVTMRLMHSTAAMLLQMDAEPSHSIGMLWDAAEHWHHAGFTEKATELLRSCAAYCVQIGRPATACNLLQRACTIASPACRVDTVKQLIAAARVAEDYFLLTDAVRQHRTLTHGDRMRERMTNWELDAIQALRFSGESILRLVPLLETCVSASHASASHRLRAACQLLAAHELNLSVHAACVTHTQLANIQCDSDADAAHRHRADMLYDTFAVSMTSRSTLASGYCSSFTALHPRRWAFASWSTPP